MRQLFIVFIVLATSSYGQSLTIDTTSKLVHVVKAKNASQPAFFVDGKFASGVILDPHLIDKINVVNGEVELGNHKYNGQVYISTKTHNSSRLISLTMLKEKYTEFKNKLVIFLVDENIVKVDYDKYVVDESYVLQIKVDTVLNPTASIDLAVIELLTKSDANIQKSKEIRIRGGVASNN
jgi:hypothetical protein